MIGRGCSFRDLEVGGRGSDEVGGDLAVDGDEGRLPPGAAGVGLVDNLPDCVQRRDNVTLLRLSQSVGDSRRGRAGSAGRKLGLTLVAMAAVMRLAPSFHGAQWRVEGQIGRWCEEDAEDWTPESDSAVVDWWLISTWLLAGGGDWCYKSYTRQLPRRYRRKGLLISTMRQLLVLLHRYLAGRPIMLSC